MPIVDLETHPAPYLTVSELAEYWKVSRNHIRKAIQSGELAALRFGPHVCRIATSAACQYERHARLNAAKPVTQPRLGPSGVVFARQAVAARPPKAHDE
jgi:excisionase family DNA binding protein